MSSKEYQARCRQVKKEAEKQLRFFQKNRAKIVKKYKGKVVICIDEQIYAANTYDEIWEMVGPPGSTDRTAGYIEDLRAVE